MGMATTTLQTTALSLPPRRRVAIIGGSLGRLATANALHRNQWEVDVYERACGTLEQKGGGLGFVVLPLWEYL